jgi:hypothetical protein
VLLNGKTLDFSRVYHCSWRLGELQPPLFIEVHRH